MSNFDGLDFEIDPGLALLADLMGSGATGILRVRVETFSALDQTFKLIGEPIRNGDGSFTVEFEI